MHVTLMLRNGKSGDENDNESESNAKKTETFCHVSSW